MTNWWHVHWRRIALQAVLCLLLGATVGLAMLVTYEKRRSLRLPLGPAQTVGRLRVRLPNDWKVKSTAPDRLGGDCIQAEEVTADQQPPRELSIERLHVDRMVSPMEHLFRMGLFQEKDFAAVLKREKPTVAPIVMAGYPGILITQNFSAQRGPIKKELVACAMLPSAQALVIKLDGVGEADAADEVLARQMAESVGVANVDPPLAGGGAVWLPDGISVDVPRNFRLLPNDDPNRISRQLLSDGSGNSWATVELISCLFFPDNGPNALTTMLLARDGNWNCKRPEQIGARLWQVDRADDLAFPCRAYLLANGENQALLAVFRGGLHDSAAFDAAWATMAASVRFTAHPDCAAMLQCGAEQAQRVASRGLGQFIAPAGAQQWSRWDQSENLDKNVWLDVTWQSHQDADGRTQWQGEQEQRAHDGWGREIHDRLKWSADEALAHYSMTLRRDLTSVFPDHAVALDAGQLRIEPPQVTGSAVPCPAQFLPGGPLPLLLGQLDLGDRTALIRTDSFPGCPGPQPSLLTLIVADTGDGPAKPDETGRPMRCVCVRVNGTGRLTRFYYAGGALRYIDFAAGLHAAQTEGK